MMEMAVPLAENMTALEQATGVATNSPEVFLEQRDVRPAYLEGLRIGSKQVCLDGNL